MRPGTPTQTSDRLRVQLAAVDLRLQVVELLLVGLLDPVDQVVVHEAHQTERGER